MRQVELCKELVSSLSPAAAPDRQLILAGALSKAGKTEEAVAALGNCGSDPVLALTAAHILLAAGQVEQALTQLTSLPPDWRYRVGILSTLVCLYLAKEDRPAAASVLKAAVEWNRGAGQHDTAGMAVVWRKTAEFHLKSGEAEVAAQSLEELQKLEPGLSTLAQLVLAYAR